MCISLQCLHMNFYIFGSAKFQIFDLHSFFSFFFLFTHSEKCQLQKNDVGFLWLRLVELKLASLTLPI